MRSAKKEKLSAKGLLSWRTASCVSNVERRMLPRGAAEERQSQATRK